MFKVASNLTMMFKEVEFSKRFEKAAKAGFGAVEMLWPYELAKADLKKLLDDNGLKLALLIPKAEIRLTVNGVVPQFPAALTTPRKTLI